jgi:hypothetical protein
MSHYVRWTESEVEILRKNYFLELGDLSKKLDRTEDDISLKMVQLGIIKKVEDANGYTFNIFASYSTFWHRFMLKLKKYSLKERMDIHTEAKDPYIKFSEVYHLCEMIQNLEERIEILENR